MSRLRLLAATAAASLGLLALAAPASAGVRPHVPPVLALGSTGGPAVAVGDTVTAPLKTGTTLTVGSVTCTAGGFTATDLTNPTAPGTAQLGVSAMPIAACGTGTSVSVVNLPLNLVVTSPTKAVLAATGTPFHLTVTQSSPLGSVTCVYAAGGGGLQGSVANPDNSMHFSNTLAKFSGSAACPVSAAMTMTYAPMNVGGTAVFVN